MAKQFPALTDEHTAFIARQRIFFVASSAAGSHVNLSPRPMDSFRPVDPATVAYLDRTGSGNETAAHIRAGGRMTIMFCAFDGAPLIMRLYGSGTVHHRNGDSFRRLLGTHFEDHSPLGTRQIVTLDIELVQTSCGYGVPFFDYQGERSAIDRWSDNKGPEGIKAYWREKNVRSLDGLPTGLFEHEESNA